MRQVKTKGILRKMEVKRKTGSPRSLSATGDNATQTHRHTVVRLVVTRDLRNVKENASCLAIENVTLAGLGFGRLGSAALTHSLSLSL